MEESSNRFNVYWQSL